MITKNRPINKESKEISHACLIKFHFIYDNLKSAERKAADFCLSNPSDVATLTISEVAERSGCSEATLVRLARRLGYGGYPELRANILPKEYEDIFNYIGISESDSLQSITSSVFNSCILYLQDSLQSIDYGALSQAIDLLAGSRRFIFAASGDAHFIAASAAQKFMRIGYQTTASSDFDSQLIALSQMTPEDALICISHSGKTRNICSLAKVAREHGIKVITITNFPGAPLAKHSDILLLTASFSYDVMDEVLAKRVPALCLLDTLYQSVLMKKKSSLQPLIDNVNEYLSLNKH